MAGTTQTRSDEIDLHSYHVSISRLWNHPKIYTLITKDGIQILCTLDDFLAALKYELSQNDSFEAAVRAVELGIKMETSKV